MVKVKVWIYVIFHTSKYSVTGMDGRKRIEEREMGWLLHGRDETGTNRRATEDREERWKERDRRQQEHETIINNNCFIGRKRQMKLTKKRDKQPKRDTKTQRFTRVHQRRGEGERHKKYGD